MMKIKHFLIAGVLTGLVAFVVACGAQLAADAEAPVIPNETVEESAHHDNESIEESTHHEVSDEDADTAAEEMDEEALQEAINQMLAAQQPREVVLDGAAMADFLQADLNTTNSGLQYAIETEGTGVIPETGDVVQVHYTGKLADGTVFDSSIEHGQPFVFPLGEGMVIPGWDEGVSLLSVGSKAKFIIPSALAYGEFGAGNVIPPNADVYFEVELLDILPGSPEVPLVVADDEYTTTDSGLMFYDFAEGDGAMPEAGQWVAVHYTGWLEDGTKFDSSLDFGQPFVFPLGEEYVIPGWEEGITSMQIGGKRQLVVPADLAFGEQGAGDVIPPDATLIFEVELVEIQS
jgi:peptidylprolyl isomerase